MIRTFKIISLVSLMLMVGCGGSPRRTPGVDASGSAYDLLIDDGNGVIFNANDIVSGAPAQIKFYDNDLRMILKGETFPGSTGSPSYVLEYVPSRIVLFDVDYNGQLIDKIVCEESNNTAYQLYFDDHITNSNSSSTNLYDDDGIYWAELIDMNGVALVSDKNLPCLGGGKSFNLKLFKENGVTDPTFTLYMDFVDVSFRGRMVVTEAGKDPELEGVALDFN
jgi:hypothetical protein